MIVRKFLSLIGIEVLLFGAAAGEVTIDFPGGVLDGTSEEFACMEKKVNFDLPAGEIEFDFKPVYGLEKKYPDRLQTYYLFTALTEKGGIFSGINVNPKTGIPVIWLYGRNPGENGAVFGVQGPFTGKKNEWTRIKVEWNPERMRLSTDGRCMININLKPLKGYHLEFPDSIRIGGGERAPSAHGFFRNFIIRSKEQEKTARAEVRCNPALERLEIFADEKERFHLVAESPNRESSLTVIPGTFPIRKGVRYYVDLPNSVPYEVVAEKDGELKVAFPARFRADMILSPSQGGNLLKNGGFEQGVASWTGDGNVTAEKKMFRSGAQSLKLNLEKVLAEVRCKSEKIPVEPGKSYRFSAFYRQEGTRDDTLFGAYIYLYRDGGNTPHLAATDYEYHNFPKECDAENDWQYTQLTAKVPASWKGSRVEARVLFAVKGYPGTVYWDDADFRLAPPSVAMAGKVADVKEKLNDRELLAYLEKRQPYNAKIVKHNDAPALEVNGKLTSPIPLCSWNSGLAATAADMGLEIIMVDIPVNYWDVVNQSVWQGKDKFDFNRIDTTLRDALKLHPSAKLLLKIGGAYKNFAADVPASRWVDSNGNSPSFRNAGSPSPAYSMISGEVRQACADAYRKICEHIARSPYGKAVIGYKIQFGGDGQWYPADSPWNFKNFDYSEGSRRTVAAGIKEMYRGDLSALRKAWDDPSVTFESIRLPAFQEFNTDRRLLDPSIGTNRRLIDCVLVYHREIVKTIDLFCKTVKESMGRDVIAGTYYTTGGGICHEELLRSEHVDFFATPGSYMRKRNLGAFSTTSLPLASARLHNKMFFEEMDYRNDYSNCGNFTERQYLGVPFDASPENAFNQLRRSFGCILAQGQTGWFMTMGQRCHFTWYGPYSAILKEVAEAARQVISDPVKNDWNGVLFFHEEKQQLYYTTQNQLDHLSSYLSELFPADNGIPWQHYYTSDLANPARPKSRLNIFTGAVGLSEKEIAWIEKEMQKDNNILVFFNDAGAAAPGGFEKNIFRLTGIHVKQRPDILTEPTCSTEGFTDPVAVGLPVFPLYGLSGKIPLHFIDDPGAVPLARYLDSGHIAGVIKRHKNWTAVYFGSLPGLTMNSKMIRALAREAGIQPVAPEGDVFASGNGVLVLHAKTSGMKTLQWKGTCSLIDLATGKIIVRDTEKFTFPMKAGETRWFKKTGK